jgi:cell division protein FtsA
MKNLISAIDVGSSKIKVLIAKKKQKGPLEFFYKRKINSEGVKKGTVFEPRKLAKVLLALSKKVSQETKKQFPPVFANLGGNFVKAVSSRGLVSVSRADQKISPEDVERVLKAAQAINLGFNKEILEVLPQEYIVDGEKDIQDPVGMRGLRLEVDTLILTGTETYFENLKKSFLLSEIEVLDFISSPVSLPKSVLKEREMQIGVCLLNIGAETTEVYIFENGKLIHFTVLPIGGLLITNKIAIFLKTDFETAERVKLEYGSCLAKGKREKIEIGEEGLSFTLTSLSKEIKEGYSKIFDEVKKELKKISKDKKLPAGIVLTGGGAKVKKLSEFAKQKFKLTARIGKPKGILGLDDDPSFSLSAGLILAGIEREQETEGPSFLSKIAKFFKNFLP